MTKMFVPTTCPCCAAGCEVDFLEHDGEVECPICAWEFAIDPDGDVVDDGGLDPEPPGEIGPDGEWSDLIDDGPLVLVAWDPTPEDEEEDWIWA